ncbi:MAG TPA: hypothetical protein VF676_01190 [Flavobacterium sp.]|jgi:hypothetical protein
MSRNNEKNIKKHNDKLHKAQQKDKSAASVRRERLSLIIKAHNSANQPTAQNTPGHGR